MNEPNPHEQSTLKKSAPGKPDLGNSDLWKLDPRLLADTDPVAEVCGCSVLLMNDRRWPWLIVVPQVPGAEELFDLDKGQQQEVLQLVVRLGEGLKTTTETGAGPEKEPVKINTAAIGNIVRQLHIHIVARREGDANWPAPVWGYGMAEKYEQAEKTGLILKIQSFLQA